MATLTKTFNVRMDEDLLNQAKKIAKENGSNLTEWFRLFSEQVVLTGGLPLQDTEEIKTEKAVKEFRDKVYRGYLDMREGRSVTLDEAIARTKEWYK